MKPIGFLQFNQQLDYLTSDIFLLQFQLDKFSNNLYQNSLAFFKWIQSFRKKNQTFILQIYIPETHL